MIIGTWNLEVYPSPTSSRGIVAAAELDRHQADIWFLTELNADWTLSGYHMHFADARPEAPQTHRKVAISSRFPLEPIDTHGDLEEGRVCLARITIPTTGNTVLATATALPWRGASPLWRERLQADVTYAEIYRHLLHYAMRRLDEERRPHEDILWGGDFNHGFYGREYVGTTQGRTDLMNEFTRLDLQVPTASLPALNPQRPAIDHIAMPAHWKITAPAAVHYPTRNEKPLSDHALYLVEVAPTHPE